ncbi:MAG: tetratricopeptide repeat protein [Rhodospirillales bacterium]|nr:tetratricopeptide repeat protein [Rhodospirillales bacterium]
MSAFRATVLALAVLLAGGRALADQRDARLPDLFAQLLGASDIGTAQAVEARIWSLWYEHDDNAIVLLMHQARAAMARQDHGSALRSLDQVVKIAPDFAEGWNARATLYYLMGRHADSLADIERTLALEPRHFGALSGRGLVYLALEKWELALGSFEAALAVNPQMPGARLNAEAIRKTLRDREI